MITELTLKNFKRVEDETYRFGELDLLLGRNNSGKSTVLQALAIWQYCVDEFRQSKSRKDGDRGIQVVLPNFLLFRYQSSICCGHNRIDRRSIVEDGKRKPKYI
jgi:AAA15 family ATPase/GTPase